MMREESMEAACGFCVGADGDVEEEDVSVGSRVGR